MKRRIFTYGYRLKRSFYTKVCHCIVAREIRLDKCQASNLEPSCWSHGTSAVFGRPATFPNWGIDSNGFPTWSRESGAGYSVDRLSLSWERIASAVPLVIIVNDLQRKVPAMYEIPLCTACVEGPSLVGTMTSCAL